MYKVGDLVMYGGEGVCRIESIGCPDTPSADKTRIYYTLKSVFGGGTTYTPIDTRIRMRPVISCETAQKLVERIPQIQAEHLDGEAARDLADHYRKTMMSYECDDLIKLIKTVYSKKRTAAEKGKKLGQTDEKFMKRAEDMLYSELAVALGIQRDEVKGYIKNAIEKDGAEA